MNVLTSPTVRRIVTALAALGLASGVAVGTLESASAATSGSTTSVSTTDPSGVVVVHFPGGGYTVDGKTWG
ncbi:MAG: hypothetical protein WAL50_10120 [Kineosporiaceae bacterium]|jgi:hypothetical protein